MLRPLLILTVTGLLASASHGALALQSYDANKHHRFANHGDFIGSGYDWSGVARSNTSGRWVTMISSTYFITATHTTDPYSGSPLTVGHNVVFYEDNNPSGTTVTRSVASVTRIGTTDIIVERLSSTPGPTIATYGIAMNPATSATFGSSVYSDRVAFIVGLNSTGSGTTQFRVGRNELDGFEDVVPLGPSASSAITFDDDRGTPQSLGADEAYLIPGDSGAPLFVTSGSDLVLVGTNWFQDTDSNPNRSGATFLPSHIAAITAIVAGGGESITLVSVPEPSALLLIGFSTLTLLRRRR